MKPKPILKDNNIQGFFLELADHFAFAMMDHFNNLHSAGEIEPLHDMRVASRRLRETLQLFESHYSSTAARKLIAKIKKVTGILGLPRQMDVNVTLLRGHSPQGGLVAHLTHEHLIDRFEMERSRLRRKMKKSFEKLEVKVLQSDLNHFKESDLRRHAKHHVLFQEHQAAECENFLKLIPMIIKEKSKSIMDFKVSENLHNDQELHRLRITAKKFRYVQEILNLVKPGTFDELIGFAKSLQEILGSIHDYSVVIERLKSHQACLIDKKLGRLADGCEQIIGDLQEQTQSFHLQVEPAHATLVKSIDAYLSSSGNHISPSSIGSE